MPMIFFVDKQFCYRLLLPPIATTNAAAAAAAATAAAAAAYTISSNFIKKKIKCEPAPMVAIHVVTQLRRPITELAYLGPWPLVLNTLPDSESAQIR
jgi:hypothetical protein